MKNDRTVATVRKIYLGNTAFLLCLPLDFIRRSGIARGDEVVVSYTDTVLMVMPNPSKVKDKAIIKGEMNGNIRTH